eukprot:CAMPEP_0117433826 /NCGR_PEP_ID=MMETSP0758-20121206/13109_1 /TAXON_ID=63605 /ORGANISM="Percolomonas cosmopolitus, Strain AE-1 (ATCC 50343)" /LENGTH=83 /DNA_ID=CAMNT_0005224721 /DNA_START=374 /DNA_END=622 /DNA_ORIENTATION=-
MTDDDPVDKESKKDNQVCIAKDCNRPSMMCTTYCYHHIMQDPKQKLYHYQNRKEIYYNPRDLGKNDPLNHFIVQVEKHNNEQA